MHSTILYMFNLRSFNTLKDNTINTLKPMQSPFQIYILVVYLLYLYCSQIDDFLYYVQKFILHEGFNAQYFISSSRVIIISRLDHVCI